MSYEKFTIFYEDNSDVLEIVQNTQLLGNTLEWHKN